MKIMAKLSNNSNKLLILSMHFFLCAVIVFPSSPSIGAETTRVSLNNASIQGNDFSNSPSISADGRFVAFESFAENLVANDTNHISDVFVRDRVTNKTRRISISSNGEQSNGPVGSATPAISADGRYVAFVSLANNLVIKETNGQQDIFVRDLLTNQTTRVSVNNAGIQSAVFGSDSPAISGDGRFVAFRSFAENLVANDTNGQGDIFVRDRLTNRTSRVSIGTTGIQGNAYCEHPDISSTGRYVVFASASDNLVLEDTNGVSDIFVRDRVTAQTLRVSVNSDGEESNNHSFSPTISADGRFIAFHYSASNLVVNDTNNAEDIFIHDRLTSQTTRVSENTTGLEGNGDSRYPVISADERYVVFQSGATNLIPKDLNGKFDIFVHDRVNGQTSRLAMSNVSTTPESAPFDINADSRFVAFASEAVHLVVGDTNKVTDIFVRDRILNRNLSADLKLTQNVSSNPVPVGSFFNFTATISNLGTDDAYSVTLTNLASLTQGIDLPPILTPSQGSCLGDVISVCRLGKLKVGQHATVKITYKAKNAVNVSNRVSVNTTPKDPILKNNSVVTRTQLIN